jgi:TrmH RNA methyltransferase
MTPPRKPIRPNNPRGEAARPPGRPQREQSPPGRHRGEGEEKYHGLRACEALFARRPDDIIRVYLNEERGRYFSDLLRWCSQNRKGYQIVEDDNLERITGSIHHEGIAILAKEYRRWGSNDLIRWVEEKRLSGPLLYLDGVQNPHNLGSILRTSAHFGVGAILGQRGDLPPLSPAAVRVAEGGAEFVPTYGLTNSIADLEALKEFGFRMVATSSHHGEPIYTMPLTRRVVLILGSEGEGVSPPVEALADTLVQIPGTGKVESLNVAMATGILLSEVWRKVNEPPPGDRNRPPRRR